MRGTRFGVSFAWSLLAAVAVHAQAPRPDLPSYLRGTWTTQSVSFGVHHATVRLPDGWSIREGGISISDAEASDCHINFVLLPGDFDHRLAEELAADRKISRYALHSELFRAGGAAGVRVVSVRYADDTERSVHKRYFELPSDEGNTLLAWILSAPSTQAGKDCARRFSVVAESFRLRPLPVNADSAPPH